MRPVTESEILTRASTEKLLTNQRLESFCMRPVTESEILTRASGLGEDFTSQNLDLNFKSKSRVSQ